MTTILKTPESLTNLHILPNSSYGIPVTFSNDQIFTMSPNDITIIDFENKVVEAVKWNYEQSKIAKQPHEEKMQRLWSRYNNQYDHEGKAEWQSQRDFPKVRMGVERITAVISRILTLARGNWFKVSSRNPLHKPVYSLFKSMMMESLDNEDVKFFDIFQKSLKAGLVGNLMCVIVSWAIDGFTNPIEEESNVFRNDNVLNILTGGMPEVKTRSHLSLAVQNPRNIYLDPTGRDRFIQLTRAYSKGEFTAEATARNFLYINETISSASPEETKNTTDLYFTEMSDSEITRNDSIFIIEHYGDLYDKDGYLLMKDSYVIVSNKKYAVDMGPYPYAHETNPVVKCGLIDSPFSVYPESHMSIDLDPLEAYVEFLNLMIDFYKTRVLSFYELNEEVLSPDEDLEKDGLHPGRVIRKTGPEPAINASPLGDAPPMFYQFIDILYRENQEGSGVYDAMAGLPRTRGQQSAQEFTRRIAEGGALFDYAFRNIENQFLVPILRQCFINMLQFTPQDTWRIWIEQKIAELIEDEVSQIGKQMNNQLTPAQKDMAREQIKIDNPLIPIYRAVGEMSPQERLSYFAKDITFKTEVFSAVFDRQAMLEKISYFIGTVSRIPMAVAAVKWNKVMENVIESLGWEAVEYIRTEEETIMMLQTMQKIQGYGQSAGFVPSDELSTQLPTNISGGQANAAASGVMGSSGQPQDLFKQLVPGQVQAGNPGFYGQGQSVLA